MEKNIEKTTTKKKKATTKKPSKSPAKKKAKRKASEKTSVRKYRLRPEERISIKSRLVAHFGKTKVATALSNCKLKADLDAVLLQWKRKLEQEIEDEERNVNEYYTQIDKEYKSVGRPKSVFNWKEFDYLCSIGCTLEEMAGFFQLSKCELQRKVKQEYSESFSEYYEKKSQGIKIGLRRRQIQAAMDGSDTMLKFLGKNILGQKEKLDFEGEVKVNSWVDLVNNLDPSESEKDASTNEEQAENES